MTETRYTIPVAHSVERAKTLLAFEGEPKVIGQWFAEARMMAREYLGLVEQYGTLHLAAEAVFRSGYDAPSGMRGRYVNAQDMDALGAVLYPASEPKEGV